ncbi:MoxR-like ATPase [Arboricoccus pini]|uniref:MoxR-like ATPase n=1 Tax=Arboricoccus pini TaxID=1963835 RepID=A0A212R0Z1_9PROT|nr:MoxR family ATPase [Arboricoccus pini]SNB65521.1 MoxR-like ATPase [Arboricoccus pini]
MATRGDGSTDPVLSFWRQAALEFEAEVAKAVLGQDAVIRLLTIAIFARGHVLLEGDVGVGKTTLLRAVAHVLGGLFERIEGTVDLMPSDLIYHTYIGEDGRPRVEPGPILRHGGDLSIFFFNEINRARPQVHALLLRLMAEKSIAAFARNVDFPYLQIFADRNRIEREETFELPAAARDRFLMEINVATPTDSAARRALIFSSRFHDVDRLIAGLRPAILDYRELGSVAERIQVSVDASSRLQDYVMALWDCLRRPTSANIVLPDVDMERLVEGGGSPRGLSFLIRAAKVAAWLDGRIMLVPEDIRAVFTPVMAHRIFLDPVYDLRREAIVADLCQRLFEAVPVP